MLPNGLPGSVAQKRERTDEGVFLDPIRQQVPPVPAPHPKKATGKSYGTKNGRPEDRDRPEVRSVAY
jgi:hypothetical protein